MLDRGPRGELVDVPELGRMWMVLPGSGFWEDLEFAMLRFIKEQKLTLGECSGDAIEIWKMRRVLAQAARDPTDKSKPWGTLEEWSQFDTQLLENAWNTFGDVRERLGLDVKLSASDRSMIIAAIKKKEATLLKSFGLTALVTCLVTTEFQLETSPPPKSSDGDSSPAS